MTKCWWLRKSVILPSFKLLKLKETSSSFSSALRLVAEQYSSEWFYDVWRCFGKVDIIFCASSRKLDFILLIFYCLFCDLLIESSKKENLNLHTEFRFCDIQSTNLEPFMGLIALTCSHFLHLFASLYFWSCFAFLIKLTKTSAARSSRCYKRSFFCLFWEGLPFLLLFTIFLLFLLYLWWFLACICRC